ncbi:hypothetical protein V8F20_002327 [Naviculisporaceae sp. PSN 640]
MQSLHSSSLSPPSRIYNEENTKKAAAAASGKPEVQHSTRLDAGADRLLRKFHSTTNLRIDEDADRGKWNAIDRVQKFVGSCAAVAASSQSAGTSLSLMNLEARWNPDTPGQAGSGASKGKRAMKKTVRWELPLMSGASTVTETGEATVGNDSEDMMSGPSGVRLPLREGSEGPSSPYFLLPWPETTPKHSAPTWHAGVATLAHHVNGNMWAGDWNAAVPELKELEDMTFLEHRRFLEWQEILGALDLGYALYRAAKIDRDLQGNLQRMAFGKKTIKVPKIIKDPLPISPEDQPAMPPKKKAPKPARIIQRTRWVLGQIEQSLDRELPRSAWYSEFDTIRKDGIPSSEELILDLWVNSQAGHTLYELLQEWDREVTTLMTLARDVMENLNHSREAIKLIREIKDDRVNLPVWWVRDKVDPPLTSEDIPPMFGEGAEYSIDPAVLVAVEKSVARITPAIQEFLAALDEHAETIRLFQATPDIEGSDDSELSGSDFSGYDSDQPDPEQGALQESNGQSEKGVKISDGRSAPVSNNQEVEMSGSQDDSISETQGTHSPANQEPETLDEEAAQTLALEQENEKQLVFQRNAQGCRDYIHREIGEIRAFCDVFFEYAMGTREAARNLARTMEGTQSSLVGDLQLGSDMGSIYLDSDTESVASTSELGDEGVQENEG